MYLICLWVMMPHARPSESRCQPHDFAHPQIPASSSREDAQASWGEMEEEEEAEEEAEEGGHKGQRPEASWMLLGVYQRIG